MRRMEQTKRFVFIAAIAVSLVGMSAPAWAAETAGQYVDDTAVSTKVRLELIENQALKAFDIHVTTNQDIVELTGAVRSADQKAQAEQIARAVDGVRDVKNDLVVQ